MTDRKPRRWPKRLLKLFLWMTGTIVALWTVTFALATWELSHAVGALKEREEPTTLAEAMERNHAKAGTNNGADLIRQAIEEDKRVAHPGDRLTTGGTVFREPIPSEKRAEIEALLDRGRTVFPLIDRATRLPAGPLSKITAQGMDHETVQNIRRLARLLSADVRFSAIIGDKKRTLQRLKTLYLLSEQLAADQFVISQLVRVALMGVAMDPTRIALEKLDFSAEELDEICEFVGRIETNFKVSEAMINDRAAAAHLFQSPQEVAQALSRSAPITPTTAPTLGERTWWITQSRWADVVASPVGLPARLRAASKALQVPNKVCELVDVPQPWSAELLRSFEENRFSLDVATLGLETPTSTGFAVLVEAAKRARQRLDLTRIAIRLRRHALVHGRLPDKLEEIRGGPLPSIPTKWFEGSTPDYSFEENEVYLRASSAQFQMTIKSLKTPARSK